MSDSAVETHNYTFKVPPAPDVLLAQGGLPGVEYLYVLAENAVAAQGITDPKGPWLQLQSMPMFTIAGRACMMLGRGKPIIHARAGAVRCRFYIDDTLADLIDDTLTRPEPTRVKIPSDAVPKHTSEPPKKLTAP